MSVAIAAVEELGRWTELVSASVPRRAQTAAEAAADRGAYTACVHLLASLVGEPAGAGFAGIEPGGAAGVADTVVAVPELTGRGVGAALLAALSDWAAAHGVAELEGEVAEDDAASLAWAERRGFAEISRDSLLVLDLAGLEPPRPDPPAGIEIVTLAERPELAPGLYEVAREAEPDIPGHEDDEIEPLAHWLAHALGGSGDRPEATFAALAGGEVVGYSKFHLTAARPDTALHDVTGVRRAWRGRGIAGALKRAQIAWAIGAGYRRLETMNEVRNTPIRRLNERLGYRLAPGRVLVRGPIRPADASAVEPRA